MKNIRQLLIRRDSPEICQVQIGIHAAGPLKEVKDGRFQVLLRVVLPDQGLFDHILAVNGGTAVGSAEPGNPEHGGPHRELELRGGLFIRRLLPGADRGHRRGKAVLPDHIQEFHLNVHPRLDIQHVAVDHGTHAMAAGNKALPLQRGQDIPELGTADAQLDTEQALPGQTLALGVLTGAHRCQQLSADRLCMGSVRVHSIYLI